jgi:fructose-1,6-bisphosphatase I
MRNTNITLTRYLSGDAEGLSAVRPPAGLRTVLLEVAESVRAIAAALARGTLGASVTADSIAAGAMLARDAHAAQGAPVDGSGAEYQLAFDPLNCPWNADVNGTAGSIFSVMHVPPPGLHATTGDPFLRPGREQAAAGYAIYGPATMLVVTLGDGTHGFTLELETNEFLLTHPSIRIPDESGEIAVDASNERFWEPPVRRYVHECREGRSGCRERDFSLRWSDALVPEVHRIMMRGGLFLMPRDYRTRSALQGRLSAVYDASPLSFLVEQAGGVATTGRERVLDAAPRAFHERMPLILGSTVEVARIGRYHREHDLGIDARFTSPLFKERSLFLPEIPV